MICDAITKCVENIILRRGEDTEINQKEMFKKMMNLSDKVDTMVGNHPGNQMETENVDPSFPLEIDIDKISHY